MAKPWIIKEALDLVAVLYPDTLKYGYHLTFGGDLLRRGINENDCIDLYFHPVEKKGIKQDTEGLYNWMISLWGKAAPITDNGTRPRPVGRPVRDEDDDGDDEEHEARIIERNQIALEEERIAHGHVRPAGLHVWEPVPPRAGRAAAPDAQWFAAIDNEVVRRPAGPPLPRYPSPYKAKLQFRRSGDDINVYIL